MGNNRKFAVQFVHHLLKTYQFLFLISSNTGALTYIGPISRKSGRLNSFAISTKCQTVFWVFGPDLRPMMLSWA